MPYEMIWQPQGFVRRFYDTATAEELLRSAREAAADLRFDAVRYAIVDFTEARQFELGSLAILKEIASLDIGAFATNSRFKIAVISTSAFVKAMVGVWRTINLSPYPIEVFATPADAAEWLSEPPVPARRISPARLR